jgi:hypothetical protein
MNAPSRNAGTAAAVRTASTFGSFATGAPLAAGAASGDGP